MRGIPFLQVSASAEGAPRAGEDGAPQGRLGVEPDVDVVEGVVHGCVEAIEVFGAVYGDEEG